MNELCKKAGLEDTTNLVQRDLVFLSDRIESETGLPISLSTIKRLMNGQFSRLPQIATLDAIAAAAGYQTWQNFKTSKNQEVSRSRVTKEEKSGALRALIVAGTNIRIILAGAFILFALIYLGLRMADRKPGLEMVSKATFSAGKVTGNDIPNTVVFNYNVDSVKADSFFIQQSWDKNRRVRVFKHNHTLTDIYYEPGYHVARLIANDKIIKTVDVSIPTDRWVFYGKEGIAKGQPYYIHANDAKSRSFKLTKDDLVKSGIDVQKENIFINAFFPSHIESSSDNFVLRCRIKVDELKNDPCPYLLVEVFSQRPALYFMTIPRGCTSELVTQFGEKEINGKMNDLSALGNDPRNWQDLEFKVVNKNATISINGKRVFYINYKNSCGLITGIGFMSNGLCEVDSLHMSTIEGREIY
ncbi:hypothetical protein A4D02_14280 [Niastella koreensis]|nr:hypothetical protein A4D02_14280 [Niastella koreensis]